MKTRLNAGLVMITLCQCALAWTGCDEEPAVLVDPERFQVPTNCIRYLKWHHRKSGQVSHFAYALTRSPGERAVFRSFGKSDGKITFQIDGYLEPEDASAGGPIHAVDYRVERLTGSEVTPENIRQLVGKSTFQLTGSGLLNRKHAVYRFCGFSDAEMDRMDEREKAMPAEIERFQAERGKSFDAFNCSVSAAIVGCEGGAEGLPKPWRLKTDLSEEFVSRYASLQTAMVDKALLDSVAIGRGRIERESADP